MLRYYIDAREPRSNDPASRAAQLQYRLDSLEYWYQKFESPSVVYVFRSHHSSRIHAVVKPDTPEDLDRILKADPSWPFLTWTPIPVTTTANMLQEIFDAIPHERLSEAGPEQFDASEMKKLDQDDQRPIDPNGVYILAEKKLTALPATTPQEHLDLLWSKTIASQKMHLSDMELMDHNPIGRPEGLLVGKGTLKQIKAHVSATPIFPFTKVRFTRLSTLAQSWASTVKDLQALGVPVRESSYFS